MCAGLTLLLEPPADARVAVEETFGPVLPIWRVGGLDEAIERANDSPFGLGSAIWTRDLHRATLAAERLEAGYTWVNSVNKVYDLMMEHDFHVTRTSRVRIDHNLLAKPGTRLEDVRDIYSHEQAINQSQAFLSTLPNVRVHVVENTAMAAKRVSESDRADVAALSSRPCASLYSLDVLAECVQDRDNNYTRFACISKDLQIFPGADRTSLMVVLNHEPGSLYKMLAKFYALDLNLLKLESRPIPEREFEFMFYFEVAAPVASPEFKTLMTTIGQHCQEYRYLGSYTEVL